jgi:hypothetical protein
MTIAHDSEILGAANSAAGNYDTAITPAATPAAVCVIIADDTSASDVITSVTYGISAGAVTLTRRRFDTEATEPGGVYIYWAAGTFPAGTQTVRIARTGTDNIRAAISTMTAAAGMTVAVDTDGTGSSASVANPAWTMTTGAATTACYLGIHSGLNAMTSTPAAGWTLAPSPGFEDIGNQGRGWARRLMTTAGAAAPGWTASTADDFVGSSIAFKEVPVPLAGHVFPAVAGRPVNPGREAPVIISGG